MGGKLAHAQARGMEMLPLAGAAVEDVQMLSHRIVRPRLVGQFEVGLDHVGHIAQHRGGTLLAVFVDVGRQPGGGASLHRLAHVARRQFSANLITTDGLEAHRVEHVDAIHHPANRRLPVNGLQDAARGRRRDDVVTHPLHLHFRPCEAGPIAPDVQADSKAHAPLLQMIVLAEFIKVGSSHQMPNSLLYMSMFTSSMNCSPHFSGATG